MSRFGRTTGPAAIVAGMMMTLVAAGAAAQEPPKPGVSSRIDDIRKAGALRVGVLANLPWLAQNTSGSGEPWFGPAWTLAKEYARLLGVKVQPVPVSHETKVLGLGSNQFDVSITALAETPERLKVVDFILYSRTSVCLFGFANNPKMARAKTVDDLDKPDVTIAYLVGSAEENWVKQRFPHAKYRGVSGSGAAPVEEIMSKRADAAPINRVPFPAMQKKVKGLTALPREQNCQGSTEKAQPVGIAVAKGQGPYVEWMRAVAKRLQPQLTTDEQTIIEKM